MTNPATTSLLDRANLDRDAVRREIARGLEGADDGELFLEYAQTEALMFDNGRLKQATYDTSQGFGLRAVKDDAVGYAHSSDVSLPALIRAADAVAAVRGGYSGNFAAAPAHTNVRLYGDENPLDAPGFETKVKLLAEIDAYLRDKDPRVRQASISLGATWQVVEILRPDGESYRDIRPLVRVNISVDAGQGDRQQGLWRPRGLCALHRDQGLARGRRRRDPRGAGQSGIGPRPRWRNGRGAGRRLARRDAA